MAFLALARLLLIAVRNKNSRLRESQMIPFRSLKVAIASTVLMAAISARAGGNNKITESGSWSLWETKVNNADVCYIQSGGEGDWYMVFIKPKNNPRSPLEIQVQMLSNSRGSTVAVASIPGMNSTIAYSDIDGKKKIFQGIPKALGAFMETMKRNKDDVRLTGKGGKKEDKNDISMSGFKEMVREMEKRCNSSLPLVSADFEAGFTNAIADNVDPLKLDVTKTGQIRSLYFAAYPITVDITANKVELAKVLAKYQPSSDELTQNQNTSNRLTTVDIPNAKNDLANAQQAQATARAEIARIDATIPPLQAKVAASQKELAAAQAVIAPIKPQYDQITGDLSNAQSLLGASQNRLAYIDQRLRDGSQQLASLDAEARSLESWLPQKQNDAANARAIYNQAYQRRASFDVRWEYDTRLRQNWEYSRLANDQSQAENQARQAEMQASQVRRERDRIARDLQICRTSPITVPQIAQMQFGDGEGHEPRPPGGGNDGRGGGLVPGPRPGPGPQPDPNPQQPPPPPPPPKDCSQLEAALANADAQVAQWDRAARDARNRANQIASRMRDIERQTDWEVRNIYNDLVNREESARRDAESREQSLRNDQARISTIRNSDIPRLQNEQSSLSMERPTVLSRISSAQSDISRLSSDLAKFKASTDWDRKAAAVDAKASQLAGDQANLDSANSAKAAAQNSLNAALAREAQIKTQIDGLNAQVAALAKRAAELQAILAQLPSERAPFDQKIAELQTNLTNLQNQMLELLK